jgi:hypothetical protein
LTFCVGFRTGAEGPRFGCAVNALQIEAFSGGTPAISGAGLQLVCRQRSSTSELTRRKKPLAERASGKRLMGLEPATFCMASRS